MNKQYNFVIVYGASRVAQVVKNLPEMQETQIQPLGQEDPLGKGLATHSCLEDSHGQRRLVSYWP